MSKFRPWMYSLLAAGVLAAGVFPVRAQSVKVGVFDSQRVSEETAVGKRVQSQLSSLRSRKQAEINEKEQAVSELQKQLSQQALSLSSEKRTELEKNIQRQLLELQTTQEQASREMQLEFSTASNDFQEKLEAVVRTLGKDEGFTLILDRSVVAWSADAIDVTTVIVDRFDKMFPATAE